eukprot:gene5773-6357_t
MAELAPYLAPEEYRLLELIYNSTNGDYWTWRTDTKKYGTRWRFDDFYGDNPCRGHWQGLYCSPDNDIGPYHLFSFELTDYNLSGTFPFLGSNFSKMLLFMVTENPLLHGPLPVFTNQQKVLNLYNLSYNAFTGTIPDSFYNASYLTLVYLSNNFLTGTLPPSLYQISALEFLNVMNNSIHGTLSNSITTGCPVLIYLNLANNYFTGTIPESLFTMANLSEVYLNTNDFSGTIPTAMNGKIEILRLAHNHLDGTFPAAICENEPLRLFSLYENNLGGSVPKCISNMHALEIFQIQENNFFGDIGCVFNGSAQKALSIVDIGDNGFTGSLPEGLFQLPSLVSLAAGKNCFYGSLPQSICQASPLLRTLALDGLAASQVCIETLWDPLGVSNAYFGGLMEGTIPDCIWILPNISVLHLSGNGLSGSLPNTFPCSLSYYHMQLEQDHATNASGSGSGSGLYNCHSSRLSPTLNDVVLTHNLLTGTIPSPFQQYPFSCLDLSYNKLKGSIKDMTNFTLAYTPNSTEGVSLTLEVNRLSGQLPDSFVNAYNLNILTGNLFKCKGTSENPGDLAKHDPGSHTAVCGSQQLTDALVSFGIYLVILIGFVSVVILIVTTVRRSLQRVKKAWQSMVYTFHYCQEVTKYTIPTEEETVWIQTIGAKDASMRARLYYNVYQLLGVLTLTRRLSWLIALYSLILLIPTYFAFYTTDDNDYSMLSDRYSWITTAAFLTGELPAGILFLLWSILLLLMLHCIIRYYNLHHHIEEEGVVVQFVKLMSSAGHMIRESFQGYGQQQHYGGMMDLSYPPPAAGGGGGGDTMFSPLLSSKSRMERPGEVKDNDDGGGGGDVDKAMNTTSDSNVSQLQQTTTIATTTPIPLASEIRTSFLHKVTSRMSFFLPAVTTTATTSGGSDNDDSSSVPMLSIDNMSLLLEERQWRDFWKHCFQYTLVFLVNVAVVMSVNAGYLVAQSDNSVSTTDKSMIQILMAAFKLAWNVFALRVLINYLPSHRSSSVRLHVVLLVFNSLLAPCLATAFTDSNCFRDVFIAPQAITVSYNLNTCVENYQEYNYNDYTVHTVCTHYQDRVFTTAFTPSFIYYYTCGSKLLTLYTPVFIYIYTMILILLPLLYFVMAVVPRAYWPPGGYLLRQVDGVLRPNDRGVVNFNRLVRARPMQAFMIHHIIILLTFGVCCPVLAMVMATSLTVDTFMWQMILIRYIKYDAKACPFSPDYLPDRDAPLASQMVSIDASRLLSGIMLPFSLHSSSSCLVAMKGEATTTATATEHEELKAAVGLGGTVGSGSGSGTVVFPLDNSTGTLSSSAGSPQQASSSNVTDDMMLRLLYDTNRRAGGGDVHFDDEMREEARLFELHTICGEAWKSLRNVMWFLVYLSMAFYCTILYNFVGDEHGWARALWVVVACFTFSVLVRWTFIDLVKFVYKHVIGGFSYDKVTM